jgi:hypothetical protein
MPATQENAVRGTKAPRRRRKKERGGAGERATPSEVQCQGAARKEGRRGRRRRGRASLDIEG